MCKYVDCIKDNTEIFCALLWSGANSTGHSLRQSMGHPMRQSVSGTLSDTVNGTFGDTVSGTLGEAVSGTLSATVSGTLSVTQSMGHSVNSHWDTQCDSGTLGETDRGTLSERVHETLGSETPSIRRGLIRQHCLFAAYLKCQLDKLRLPWEESLSEELSRSGWPVGMSWGGRIVLSVN